MNVSIFLTAVLRAFDPKRDYEQEVPRPLLIAKNAVEYIFKLTGYFIFLCIVVGLSFSSCTDDPFLGVLPLALGALLMFYITITVIGIPVFIAIQEIKHIVTRRIFAYSTIIILILFSGYLFLEAPIFNLLLTYVEKFFPTAMECTAGNKWRLDF